MNRGKLIIFEGADGVGKSTQAKLFYKYLVSKKIPAVFTSFPRYKTTWGKMILSYLAGDFGNLHDVSSRLASMLYAGDRLLAKDEISKWIDDGKVVVCDRYVASNVAHQVSKIHNLKSRVQFIKWLENLEYVENKIPKPDKVLLLTIDERVAQKFMSKRKRDIHEADSAYQGAVAKAFRDYAKGKKNWITVSNMSGKKLKSLNDVHEEIKQGLAL